MAMSEKMAELVHARQDFTAETRFDDPLASPREQMTVLAERYKGIISKLGQGEVPADIPWPDPRFQQMVLRLISDLCRYKGEADKLAAIREVFGGK